MRSGCSGLGVLAVLVSQSGLLGKKLPGVADWHPASLRAMAGQVVGARFEAFGKR